MKNFIVLLPPSEGKQTGGDNDALKAYPDGVEEIHTRFLEYDGSYQKLIGVKGDYLQESIEANKNILETPTMPAIKRYTGTVYKHLDYESLRNKAYTNEHVYITSAMFGVIPATKNIPNYKLKMSKLKAWKHWKQQSKEFLNNHFVIDVLTTTHRRSVDYENGFQVDFKIKRNGKIRGAGHSGKKIKGRFVRWLAENDVETLEALKAFNEDGWEWTGEYFLKA